jgi:hypothetical protein
VSTSRILVALALVTTACTEPRSLEWSVLAEPTVDTGRAAQVLGRIRQGSCSAEVLYESVAGPDAEPVPVLPPGRYGFEAVALDTSCVLFARDCLDVQLPLEDGATIDLRLAEVPEAAVCEAALCDDGLCRPIGGDAGADALGDGGASCGNGVLDGSESDIDCGGSCDPCRFGAACRDATDCATGICTSEQCSLAPMSFGYTGADQAFVVPEDVTSLTVHAWGAGGGGADPASGGHARATLPVTAGQALTVVVGESGVAIGTGLGYGGGARTTDDTTAYGCKGGGGGGLSGVFSGSEPMTWDETGQARALVVAGGGGGGRGDGHGGGASSSGGGGGTELAGGAPAEWGGDVEFDDCCRCCGCDGMCFPTGTLRPADPPTAGLALQGGRGGTAREAGDWNGSTSGGTWSAMGACPGGGGGYFGGGGGWGGESAVDAGGGGSSYVHPSATGSVVDIGIPDGTEHYLSPAGQPGEHGLVVISFD